MALLQTTAPVMVDVKVKDVFAWTNLGTVLLSAGQHLMDTNSCGLQSSSCPWCTKVSFKGSWRLWSRPTRILSMVGML